MSTRPRDGARCCLILHVSKQLQRRVAFSSQTRQAHASVLSVPCMDMGNEPIDGLPRGGLDPSGRVGGQRAINRSKARAGYCRIVSGRVCSFQKAPWRLGTTKEINQSLARDQRLTEAPRQKRPTAHTSPFPPLRFGEVSKSGQFSRWCPRTARDGLHVDFLWYPGLSAPRTTPAQNASQASFRPISRPCNWTSTSLSPRPFGAWVGAGHPTSTLHRRRCTEYEHSCLVVKLTQYLTQYTTVERQS